MIAFDVPDAEHPGGGGEPITNPLSALDSLAFAGGISSSALTASDGPSLQARLSELRSTMVSHRLRIPDPSYGAYELEIEGEYFTELSSCDRGDGFDLLEGTGTYDTLELCGSAALALQRVGQARVIPSCVIAE